MSFAPRLRHWVLALTVLILITVLWCGVLWFAIAPDFSHWHGVAVLAVNALPPLFVWGGWLWWYRRRVARKAGEDEARELVAQAERDKRQAEALMAFEAELNRQRFACQCRLVSVAALKGQGLSEDWILQGESVFLDETAVDETEAEDMLTHLGQSLRSALGQIYAACSPALALPILVMPPAELSADEVLSELRSIQTEIAEELGWSEADLRRLGTCRFLPIAATAADSVIGAFEADPDLPGIIVLGFDSPWLRAAWGEHDITSPDTSRVPASQGVFASLATAPAFDLALQAMSDEHAGNTGDAMTPYWNKQQYQLSGIQAWLAQFRPEERAQFETLPLIGRLHRSANGELAPKARQGLALMQALRPLLERARIQAGLLNPVFAGGREEQAVVDGNNDQISDEEAAAQCRWLIHNAGSVDKAGHRLAAICGALSDDGIDLDPIENGTNLASLLGDLGRAHSLGLLAIGLARAAQVQGPVLCAEFPSQESAAFYFIQS